MFPDWSYILHKFLMSYNNGSDAKKAERYSLKGLSHQLDTS
jgi:hypothetical protein